MIPALTMRVGWCCCVTDTVIVVLIFYMTVFGHGRGSDERAA